MRQASWIAFLLLTVGLLGYEASVSQQEVAASGSSQMAPPVSDEGSWPSPPPSAPDEGSWPEPRH